MSVKNKLALVVYIHKGLLQSFQHHQVIIAPWLARRLATGVVPESNHGVGRTTNEHHIQVWGMAGSSIVILTSVTVI